MGNLETKFLCFKPDKDSMQHDSNEIKVHKSKNKPPSSSQKRQMEENSNEENLDIKPINFIKDDVGIAIHRIIGAHLYQIITKQKKMSPNKELYPTIAILLQNLKNFSAECLYKIIKEIHMFTKNLYKDNLIDILEFYDNQLGSILNKHENIDLDDNKVDNLFDIICDLYEVNFNLRAMNYTSLMKSSIIELKSDKDKIKIIRQKLQKIL